MIIYHRIFTTQPKMGSYRMYIYTTQMGSNGIYGISIQPKVGSNGMYVQV